jgi:hypothetical protein
VNLRKKLVKCYIWSVASYGAETWTLQKIDRNILKILKCGAGVGWGRSVRPIVKEMYYIDLGVKGIA